MTIAASMYELWHKPEDNVGVSLTVPVPVRGLEKHPCTYQVYPCSAFSKTKGMFASIRVQISP